MPKDLLDALIERLERESDQNEQAWEEVVQAFERLSAEERRARKEEFRARFMEYLKRQRDLASDITSSGSAFPLATTKEWAMQNGRKTNLNPHQRRPAASFAGRSQRWASSAPRPEPQGLSQREKKL
jgi:hypothetical protein